jgi:hypothetical protein
MYQDAPKADSDLFEIVRTISIVITLIFSLINLIYAVRIFNYKDKKDDLLKENELRLSAFRSLVLDYHLDKFYGFFENVEKHLLKLRQPTLSIDKKRKINETIVEELSATRRAFVNLLSAVNEKLYYDTLRDLDEMIDGFTNRIFDEINDLSNETVFQQLISNELSRTRTKALKRFLTYDGAEDALPDSSLSILPRP